MPVARQFPNSFSSSDPVPGWRDEHRVAWLFVGTVRFDTDSFVATEVVGGQCTAVHTAGIETDSVWTNDRVLEDSVTEKDPRWALLPVEPERPRVPTLGSERPDGL